MLIYYTARSMIIQGFCFSRYRYENSCRRRAISLLRQLFLHIRTIYGALHPLLSLRCVSPRNSSKGQCDRMAQPRNGKRIVHRKAIALHVSRNVQARDRLSFLIVTARFLITFQAPITAIIVAGTNLAA